MTITLNAQQEQRVWELVNSGKFSTPEAAITEALDSLIEEVSPTASREKLFQASLNDINTRYSDALRRLAE